MRALVYFGPGKKSQEKRRQPEIATSRTSSHLEGSSPTSACMARRSIFIQAYKTFAYAAATACP
jgi:hypothetical protein